MINYTDLKIGLLNGSAFLISFTGIEWLLKIILLLVSIGYTIYKWYGLHKKK